MEQINLNRQRIPQEENQKEHPRPFGDVLCVLVIMYEESAFATGKWVLFLG